MPKEKIYNLAALLSALTCIESNWFSAQLQYLILGIFQ
jgi:hypothetical protein